MKIKFLVIFLFLSLINSFACSDELNTLFLKLKNANNLSEAKKVENKIWDHWIAKSLNKENNLKMYNGIRMLNNGDINNALKIFLDLCNIEPKWAEPFNKVATIKFLQKDYKGSINYIKLTLEKERRHFGALSGLVQINLRLGKFEDALKNINKALKIHPFLEIKKLKPILLEKINKMEI